MIIAGVEDISVDARTGDIFVSAYNRRAVRNEIETGQVTTQGGLYVLSMDQLEGGGASISPRTLKSNIRPHGFGYSRFINRQKVVVVNRHYDQIAPALAQPSLDTFSWDGQNLESQDSVVDERLCSANDVAIYWNGFFVTNNRAQCARDKSLFSEAFSSEGRVYQYKNGQFSLFAEDLDFPNGVAILRRREGDLLAVALTREEDIRLYKISTR